METRTIDDRLFHNLCEITSEAWQRAVTNWGTLNQLPIRFDSRANLAVPARNRKRNRVYVPFQAGLADQTGDIGLLRRPFPRSGSSRSGGP